MWIRIWSEISGERNAASSKSGIAINLKLLLFGKANRKRILYAEGRRSIRPSLFRKVEKTWRDSLYWWSAMPAGIK